MKTISNPRIRLSALAFWTGLLILAAPAVQAEDDKPSSDVITFNNGDVMHGRMVSADGGETVTWRRQDVANAFEVNLDNLNQIQLASPAQATVQNTGSSVHLTNGDILQGTLVEMTDNALILKTPYAGTLEIRRPAVKTIFPGTKKSLALYSGPQSLEEWAMSNSGSWTYTKNALVSQAYGSVGRDVKLPDRARIDFDMTWQYHYPDLRFALYSNSPKSYSQNSYVIRASSSYLRFYRYQHGSSSSYTTAGYNFQGRKKAHLTILANKVAQTVAVQIDGQTLKQWNDTRTSEGLGSSILFQAQSGRNIAIKNIEVAEWDGVIPNNKNNASEEEEKEDQLDLLNGDKLSGTAQTIEDGTLSFRTAYAAFPIPVERVSCLTISGENAERARRNANDVTAHLLSGTQVTLDLVSVKDGKLSGKSENYAKDVSLSMDSIAKLSFNIYRESDDDDDW